MKRTICLLFIIFTSTVVNAKVGVGISCTKESKLFGRVHGKTDWRLISFYQKNVEWIGLTDDDAVATKIPAANLYKCAFYGKTSGAIVSGLGWLDKMSDIHPQELIPEALEAFICFCTLNKHLLDYCVLDSSDSFLPGIIWSCRNGNILGAIQNEDDDFIVPIPVW